MYQVRVRNQYNTFGYGCRTTREAAEELLVKTQATIGHLNDAVWIEAIDEDGLFIVPSRPTPRERFTTRVTVMDRTCDVEILDGDVVVASYHRNYGMLQTFEPFRQGDRHYALISPDYTATSVVDLQTGVIIASEEPDTFGFCPVGFYVPDWWDVHDGSVLPGSIHWSEDREWPNGDFGFVWGCIWGDDSSWKVEFLDLSQVAHGVLQRDQRFGYVELATMPDTPAKEFIRVSKYNGDVRVRLRTEQSFSVEDGSAIDPLG
jgi:hypothetical protein